MPAQIQILFILRLVLSVLNHWDIHQFDVLVFPQVSPQCVPLSCSQPSLSAHLTVYNAKRFSVGEMAKLRCDH